MDSRQTIERAFREYGLNERSDGNFESTRRIYRRAGVLEACGVGDRRKRDARMMELKEKCVIKPDWQRIAENG